MISFEVHNRLRCYGSNYSRTVLISRNWSPLSSTCATLSFLHARNKRHYDGTRDTGVSPALAKARGVHNARRKKTSRVSRFVGIWTNRIRFDRIAVLYYNNIKQNTMQCNATWPLHSRVEFSLQDFLRDISGHETWLVHSSTETIERENFWKLKMHAFWIITRRHVLLTLWLYNHVSTFSRAI